MGFFVGTEDIKPGYLVVIQKILDNPSINPRKIGHRKETDSLLLRTTLNNGIKPA